MVNQLLVNSRFGVGGHTRRDLSDGRKETGRPQKRNGLPCDMCNLIADSQRLCGLRDSAGLRRKGVAPKCNDGGGALKHCELKTSMHLTVAAGRGSFRCSGKISRWTAVLPNGGAANDR